MCNQAVELLMQAAYRIRYQQSMLCGQEAASGLSFSPDATTGLYLSLEDIYQPITEAVRILEEDRGAA